MSRCHRCPCDGGDEAQKEGGSDHGGGSGGGGLIGLIGLEFRSLRRTGLTLIPFVDKLDYSCIHNI